MKYSLRTLFSVGLGFFLYSASSQAFLSNAKMPVCLDGDRELSVDNAQVISWKTSTPNQYHDRGFVTGKLEGNFESQNGHFHFILRIGSGEKDVIEIVYNKEFGDSPTPTPGMTITVCGDYITSTARGGGYDPSPAGALIHWVHYNPGNRSSSRKHAHGFIMMGKDLIGFDDAPEGAWNGKIGRN